VTDSEVKRCFPAWLMIGLLDSDDWQNRMLYQKSPFFNGVEKLNF
jgi:hypothetical protein